MARRAILGLRTIVTGASSGIGRALVVELVRRGAKVVALARRGDRLEALAGDLAAPERFRFVVGDVTCREDRASAIEMARREFGGLDALVNNAGSGALGRFDQADEARLRHIMEINFFAAAEFIRDALPVLKSGSRPIVVNIGSVLGHRAMPEKSEYCASKFALHGLSDALRLELAPLGIELLLVSPSTTASEFFDAATSSGEREALASRSSSIVPRQSYRGAHAPRSPHRFGAVTPEYVAKRAVAAMAAGRREIILSAGGKFLVWLDRLCPPLADWFIARWV